MTARIEEPRSLAVEKIVAGVMEDVAAREARVSFQDIKAQSRSLPAPRDAMKQLLLPGCSVITELKRAVPYRGEIANFDTPQDMGRLAHDLENVGVRLMAVQTDRRRFHGSLQDMLEVHQATTVPLICRDIILDPYQVHEARCWGADVVPLQVEIMDQSRLVSLVDRIESLGMTALLEVRSRAEADRAIAARAKVIGISAWSLASDAMYRQAFQDIVPGLPSSVCSIAIGGVENGRNLFDYASHGADAVLVGESIMAANSPVSLARNLVTVGQHPACPCRKE